jgi:pimeloyl-ACP methyl ester carboxylesterase
VAVKAAALDGCLFDKILLTGAAGIILKRGFKYKLRVRAYRFVKKFAPRFAERRFGSAEYRTLSPLMKESYKKIVNEDLRGEAVRVKNRVLIVQGLQDNVTTLAEANVYLEHFPCATLKTMDGGHFAFAEHPLAFNLTAEEFLYG